MADQIIIEFTPLTDYRQIGQQLYEAEENWKKDIGNFILKWVDSSDSISAQTSGSTGEPKEIRILKSHMRNSAIMTGKFFHFEAGQKALLCLSTNFIAGKMMVVRAIIHNMTLIIVEPTSTPLSGIDTEIDFAAMVPLQVYETLNQKDGIEQLSRIKQLLIGGGALSQSLQKSLQILPNQVFTSYGMTETISHVALRIVNTGDASDWFTVLPNIDLSEDDRNCLVINAPQLSTDPIVTNDIVEFSGSNQFKIIGRADNIINTGGIKIVPETIEEKLAHEINGHFIIGSIPDEKFENKLILLIEGKPFETQQLLSKFPNILSAYEMPKEVVFIDKLERTESGKIKRNESLKKLL